MNEMIEFMSTLHLRKQHPILDEPLQSVKDDDPRRTMEQRLGIGFRLDY